MTLEEFEARATENLWHAFLVVGIMEPVDGGGGEDDFLELLHKRIAYLDLSLNPKIVEKWHASGSSMERWERVYLDWHYLFEDFQNKFRAAVPLLAVAERLY
jgi:hypothetical protein